jgi:WD40 repeat protein
VERAWRWVRRNPAVASLGVSVAVLVAALAIGSTLAAIWLNTERNRTLEHLWGAYVDRAHAGRSSRQAGQRFASLDVLNAAAKIRKNGELRNEAIACLPLVDLRPMRRFATMPHEDDGFTVDPTVERYALGDGEGNVRVHRIADGRELVRLPRGVGPNRFVEFSPDGRYLIAAYALRDHWSFVLWDLGGGGPPSKVMERGDSAIHFSPDGRRMAAQVSENTVGLYDPATGEQCRRLIVGGFLQGGFHPDGRRFLVRTSSAQRLGLIDLERGEEVWSHAFDVELERVAWRGDGRLFAAVGSDHRIYVWDLTTDRLQSVLEGHQNSVVRLQYTHAGSLLISSAWDGTLRVWDPVRGTALLTARLDLIRIGPDDRQVAVREHGLGLEVWQLADGRECRALHHGMVGNRTPRPKGWGPFTLDFSPDGRLLASTDYDGLQLWDTSTGASVVHGSLSGGIQFSPDGSHLLSLPRDSTDPALRIWPIQAVADGVGSGLRIGPPRFLGATQNRESTRGAWDATGRYLMVKDPPRAQAVVLDLSRSAEVARLGPHPGFNQCPISPDGRFVATATWKGQDVKLWEVATGRLAWQWPCDSAFVAFSPDSRWLAVAQFPGRECRFWHVGSWRSGPTIELPAGFYGAMAFAHHGRLFAIDDGGRVRLVDPDSGRELATLDAGTGSSAHFFCMAMSPDGTQVAAGRDHIIHLWDLRRIREHLAALGLDWDAPPFPPPHHDQALGPVTLVSAPEHEAQIVPIGPSSSGIDRSGTKSRPQGTPRHR